MRQPRGWVVPQVRWGSREAQRLRHRDRTPPRELHPAEVWDCGRPRDDDLEPWAEAWRRAFAAMVEQYGEPDTLPPLAAVYDDTEALFAPCTDAEHAAAAAKLERRRAQGRAKAAEHRGRTIPTSGQGGGLQAEGGAAEVASSRGQRARHRRDAKPRAFPMSSDR
jgi:hypothetical protein